MPAPLDVDREAVKTLAIAIGPRAAARKMGLPETTVRQWSSRGKWLAKPKLPPSMMQPVASVTSASDALKQHLQEHHGQTKLSLAKYARDAAEVAAKSKGNHKLARSSKDIADIMEKVHGAADKGNPGIHIGVLTGQVAIQYNPD